MQFARARPAGFSLLLFFTLLTCVSPFPYGRSSDRGYCSCDGDCSCGPCPLTIGRILNLTCTKQHIPALVAKMERADPWRTTTEPRSGRTPSRAASAAQKRAAQEEEDAETVLKRAKPSICKAAEEFVCPISFNLPVEPAVAGDVSYAKMQVFCSSTLT